MKLKPLKRVARKAAKRIAPMPYRKWVAKRGPTNSQLLKVADRIAVQVIKSKEGEANSILGSGKPVKRSYIRDLDTRADEKLLSDVRSYSAFAATKKVLDLNGIKGERYEIYKLVDKGINMGVQTADGGRVKQPHIVFEGLKKMFGEGDARALYDQILKNFNQIRVALFKRADVSYKAKESRRKLSRGNANRLLDALARA